MRFSAAIQPNSLSLHTPAASEFLRRLLAIEPSRKAESAPQVLRVDELPADLDQRVRLLGEW